MLRAKAQGVPGGSWLAISRVSSSIATVIPVYNLDRVLRALFVFVTHKPPSKGPKPCNRQV